MNLAVEPRWTPLCEFSDLVAGSGVAAKIGGDSVALFYLPGAEPELYAIGHRDPFSNAEVLAWGLVCEDQGQWSVASPLYKQHFALEDGRCLDDPKVKVASYRVRIDGDQVLIAV